MANTIIRDGTSQNDRMLAALREGYVNVDERRFENLLAMAAEYAGLLRHRDSAGGPDGNWSSFFESDEVSILSSILSLDLDKFDAEFTRFQRNHDRLFAGLQNGDVGIGEFPCLKLARQVVVWSGQLARLTSVAGTRVHERVENVLTKTIGPELERLKSFVLQYAPSEAEAAFHEFSNLMADGAGLRQGRSRVPGVRDEQELVVEFFKSNFYSCFSAVASLQHAAAALLKFSLGRKDREPAMGLFLAFLKLFGSAQKSLNGFTQRHLDFYYDEVLKIHRHDFVPDSVHLVFYPDVEGREVLIEKGTEFKTDTDENGTELIYVTDEELLVNDAKVGALHTVHCERNELIYPENSLFSGAHQGSEKRQFATGIKLNRIMDGASPAAGEDASAYPLFGIHKDAGLTGSFEDARLGFALASEVLLLQQGERDITLTFRMSLKAGGRSTNSFASRMKKLLNSEGDSDISKAHVFSRLFGRMFRIYLTSETGWLEVTDYLPQNQIIEKNGHREVVFRIRIPLRDKDAAIVPYSPGIHGESFETNLPVVKFIVNPGGYVYPYGLLREIVIREIVIDTEVRGCTDLQVYNHQGPLNANMQFTPLGALPLCGDYLIVGCYEAARKTLTDIEIELEWGGLPAEMKGFEDYYRGYPTRFDNATFKASLSVLRDRKWSPDESEQVETDLFESVSKTDKRLGKLRRFSFRGMCKFMKPLGSVARENFTYDNQAKDGFFRLMLSSPPCAFGHKDYPMALSGVMTENAALKRFKLFKLFSRARKASPLPNSPYTPLVKRLSVNYKATASINLETVASAEMEHLKEKMFHLHPLGHELLSPGRGGRVRLIPNYEADGSLCIGISASHLSGPLTLFFQLHDDSHPEADGEAPAFDWHYLASNLWKELEKSRVISDTTEGFVTSGIVTLDIPDDIDRSNTILPSDLFWLRVSVSVKSKRAYEHIRSLCSLNRLHVHVIKASWKFQAGDRLAHLESGLPAGSIAASRFALPGIDSIRQHMDSFGGADVESNVQRTVRVSERLKHKSRAITPWDYERLILQRFPEIYKVKCFSCMKDEPFWFGQDEFESRPAPGHLLIALIPFATGGTSEFHHPMVNARLLNDVREFATGLSSSFSNIRVRNPVYERIQVRCKARFKKGVQQGLYLNRLERDIGDYLSPWKPGGYEASFGWNIRCNDVQAHINSLDYIDSVTGLSMLHVVEFQGGHYRLFDTARGSREGMRDRELNGLHPWSIAIPFRKHLLEVVNSPTDSASRKTGIAKMAIGSTFIISRGNS